MQRVAPSVTARQQPHVIDDYGKDPAPPHSATSSPVRLGHFRRLKPPDRVPVAIIGVRIGIGRRGTEVVPRRCCPHRHPCIHGQPANRVKGGILWELISLAWLLRPFLLSFDLPVGRVGKAEGRYRQSGRCQASGSRPLIRQPMLTSSWR